MHQQQRDFSFFSNLLGLRSKRLDKTKTEVENADMQKSTAEIAETEKRSDEDAGVKSRRQLEREKRATEERIIGGTYVARGVPMPEKRLREWRHTVENLTLGPKKLNLVAKLIRRLPVPDARLQLRFSKKAISKDVLLALDKACMNAREKDNVHIKDLIVGQCYVGGKIIGHKVDIKARGKSGKIDKRVAHLNIILYENPALVKGFESRILLPGKYAQRQTSKSDVAESEKPVVSQTRRDGQPPLRQVVHHVFAN